MRYFSRPQPGPSGHYQKVALVSAPQSNSDPASQAAKVYSPAFFRSEEAFLEALRQGRGDAQAELFRRYRQRITALLHRVLGRDDELADLVQEVFVRALTAVKRFRGDSGALEPWLTRIAVYTARSTIRRRVIRRRFLQHTDTPPDTILAPEAAPEHVQAVRCTYAILDKMPTSERLVLSLQMIDQMSLPQIAEACDISRSTVKRRLRRARTRFETLAMREPVLLELLERGVIDV
jgi:RNA polymerase sigma-70 factor (ECF subfamily)